MTIYMLNETFKRYLNSKRAFKETPVLNMLTLKKAQIKKRCESLLDKLTGLKKSSVTASIHEDFSYIGGGALPLEKLQTYVIALKSRKMSCAGLAKRLRDYNIPIIVRVCNENVLLDMRTVFPDEDNIIVEALKEIFY
jgi:L-seryl-tRNA(Ser) seleniumtransferase